MPTHSPNLPTDLPGPAPVGVILAGGRARRMGGGDKGLRLLAGRPVLAHVIARLAPQVAALALNANGNPARFAAFGLPVLPDTVPDQPGPLAGVLAALDWAAAQGGAQVVTVPADTPFLPADLVVRLQAGLAASGASVALAATPDGLHPVVGLWSATLRADLRAALGAGNRKVAAWAGRHNAAQVQFCAESDPFFNINTSGDLASAEARLR